MAESQLRNQTTGNPKVPTEISDEKAVPLAEGTVEFLGSLHPVICRAQIYILLLFITLTLIWSWLGRVDIVASAPFRLVPLGRVQIVQATRSGKIQQIAARVGDQVTLGQVLFRLRSQETIQELRELEQAEIAFKQAEFDLRLSLPKKTELAAETISALRNRIRVLEGGMRAYRNALTSFVSTQTSSVQDSIVHDGHFEMELKFRTAEVDYLRRQFEQKRKLYEKNLISQVAMDEAEVRYLRTLAELPDRMAHIYNHEVSINELKRDLLEEKIEIERTSVKFRNAFANAAMRLNRAKQSVDRSLQAGLDLIVAPDSGIVTQVLVNTLGQVVEKGQELLTIAPAAIPIVAEAYISNRDVGLLSVEQKVKLKYEAFPYQEYGIHRGSLSQISPDAIFDEAMGMVYRGTIRLEKTTVTLDGEERPLMFGMRGTAEIITDRQSILTLVLKPLRHLRELAASSSSEAQ